VDDLSVFTFESSLTLSVFIIVPMPGGLSILISIGAVSYFRLV
jgi:hypothetical protein